MNPSGVALLDHIASEYKVTRSDVFRCCLAVALRHQEELYKMLKNQKAEL